MIRQPRKLSKRGAQFIAHFEGFRNRPYNDAAGNATIGFGHLIHLGRVTQKDEDDWGVISRDLGLFWLQVDAQQAADCILQHVHPPFRLQYRFDALVSFVFNLGCGILGPNHSIIGYLNSGPMRHGAADAMLMYDHAGGKELPGLLRRRKAERALFLYGRYHSKYTK